MYSESFLIKFKITKTYVRNLTNYAYSLRQNFVLYKSFSHSNKKRLKIHLLDLIIMMIIIIIIIIIIINNK